MSARIPGGVAGHRTPQTPENKAP